ncbi:hypothetical protein AHAS_Ahas09G0304900 [Arachis hypogaea]
MGCGSSTLGRDSRPLGRDNSENGGGQDAKNLRVKLVLLGDSGVGKSCIVLRFVRGQFDPTSKVTVGASFLSQTIALQDSTTVKFEIWDTAAVAVIVYDITSPESFSKAQYWVKELQKHGSPEIVLALVGNKADLHEKREVAVQDGIDYAEKNGMFFIETSAKTADNINELFELSLFSSKLYTAGHKKFESKHAQVLNLVGNLEYCVILTCRTLLIMLVASFPTMLLQSEGLLLLEELNKHAGMRKLLGRASSVWKTAKPLKNYYWPSHNALRILNKDNRSRHEVEDALFFPSSFVGSEAMIDLLSLCT